MEWYVKQNDRASSPVVSVSFLILLHTYKESSGAKDGVYKIINI